MRKDLKSPGGGNKRRKPAGILIAGGALAALAAVFVIIKIASGAGPAQEAGAAPGGAGVTFEKSGITQQAAFLPYQSGRTVMEVIAVKAPDGTIRTALNTCQVCYDSGRGYYVQEGDQLVCQNCGNRFPISRIGLEKNGCNPVPVTGDDKRDDGTSITISASFLDGYAEYFRNWKR